MILIIAGIFCLSILLCMIRAVIGATAFDRVVSVDTLTSLSIAVLVLLSLHFGKTIFLDVALVYAVVAFLGDLAVSKYLEGRGLGE